MIVRDVLRDAAGRLEAAGIDTPRLDAEVLLSEATGMDRGQLISNALRELEDSGPFEQMLARRLAREPVAYILGRKGFRYLDLEVDGRVLVPRPETELLVDMALGLPQGARVIDVGTGSGNVALALKSERPDLQVVATDVSAEAAEVARENAQRLGLDVEVLVGDLLEPVQGDYDAVLANPPYVRDGVALQPEINIHEPDVSLYGGADGLDIYRRLVPQVIASAATFVAFEVGQGMAQDVGALFGDAFEVELYPDLAKNERVVVGRR